MVGTSKDRFCHDVAQLKALACKANQFILVLLLSGDFFIMDSEQLVCNPYQEMQNEVMDSVKKSSFTEKLTSVKNNVCEHQLKTKARYIDRERQHKLRNLHIDSNNLRYEVKLMDIKRQKNELEMQKRIRPEKDFSYDTRQISNTEKRLGVIDEDTYYLAKKQKYPLRGNILRDHNKKPIIKQARKTMHDHKKNQKKEEENEENDERAYTALTTSTAINIVSTPPSRQENHPNGNGRRGSKSAPPITQGGNGFRTPNVNDDNEEKLPIIQSRVGTATKNVKFLVEEPKPYRQSTPTKLHRSKTFHQGMRLTRSASEAFWDSDSDDDYSVSEKIDLRAILFGSKSQVEARNSLPSGLSGPITPRTLTRLSSADVPLPSRCQPPRPTEEQVKAENKKLRGKIDKFLGTIRKPVTETDKKSPEKVAIKDKESKDKAKDKDKDKAKEEKSEKPDVISDSVAKAITYMKIFSKPIDPSLQWGGAPVMRQKSADKLERELSELSEKEQKEEDQPAKKMWEFIKTEINNGNVKRKYSANALLLQQLTGILIEGKKRHVIPTNAASRALRHTPTFKMRRVVEEMMRQRTRFEQQEVEKLQKKDAYGEGGMYGVGGANEEGGIPNIPSRAWATPTRQLEQES